MALKNQLVVGGLIAASLLGGQPKAEAIDTLYFTLKIGNTIDGTNYDSNDILKYDVASGTTGLFLDTDSLFKKPTEAIDALYIFPNGDLLISTTTNAAIGSLNFKNEDLVRVNPVTKDASIFLDGSAVFKNVRNLQSVDVLSDGQILFSADTGKIGSLKFTSHDLVLYDPSNGNASLFFDGSDHFEGKKGSITGVDLLDDGRLVLIVGDETDAIIGGVHVDRKDIFAYDPATKTTEILLDGRDDYFQRKGHKHDQGFSSVFVPEGGPVVPEPVTASLFGLGLLGMGFWGRRRKVGC